MMIINPYILGAAPTAIGTIFNETQLIGSPLNGFSAGAWDSYATPNPTYSANNINLNTADVGGPPWFANTLVYKNWYTEQENFVWEAEVQITDITKYGISLSLWYFGNTVNLYSLWLFGSGRMDFWEGNNFIQNVPAGSVVIANNDWIKIKIIRLNGSITCSAENLTQSLAAVTFTYTFLFTSPFGNVLPQTFRPAFSNMGGNNNIRNFSYSTIDKKNVDILFITDSKGIYFANTYANSWINQLRTANPTKTIEWNGSANETLENSILKEEELKLYKAKKVFIFQGCNDLRSGASQATIQTRLQIIKTFLESVGSEVFFIESTPEGPGGGSINSTTVNAAGVAIFNGAHILPTYTPYWSGIGTGANAALTSPDLIHFNSTLGQTTIKSIVQSYL